jgi:putative nucleotidyltransferase with HDIG domain
MNVEEFPTLPVIITKVIAVCENEESSAEDLAKVISFDQSITSRIIKLANSAYFGYLRKVNTLTKAVTILGFETIKSLSISASVFDTFKKIKSNYYFDRCQFWIHSIGVGVISKMIARKLNYNDIEVAFLNGLLHDIGKLFFESYYVTQYESVMKEVTVNRLFVKEAEEMVFGVMHSEVGGWLANRWKFHPELVYPIQYHHHLDKCPEEYLTLGCIVQLADRICREHHIGSGGDSLIPELDPLVYKTLNITDADIKEFRESVDKEKENIFTFMAIMD